MAKSPKMKQFVFVIDNLVENVHFEIQYFDESFYKTFDYFFEYCPEKITRFKLVIDQTWDLKKFLSKYQEHDNSNLKLEELKIYIDKQNWMVG